MATLTNYAIPGFIGLMLLEAVVAARRGVDIYDRRDTFTSLAMGIGNVLINLGWKGVAFAVYSALYDVAFFDLGHGLLAWIALLFAEDLCYYWFHRAHHEIRVFWAAHVTHHSSQRYNLSTALRQSWTSSMTGLIFWAPLPLLGFEPTMIMTMMSISLLYQFWIHTEMIDKLGRFEWLMNTPSHHRVHHGANLRYLDRNYAGIFIFWDRLFGTFEPEVEPVRFGLTKNIDSHNPIWVAFHEWVGIVRDVIKAPTPAAILGYVLAPPGWSPDGSTVTTRAMQEAATPSGLEALGQ
jgi:sterol desaturase/sphingolipid hydroxylase (fatty acid hydroxylase superfamily)